MIPFAIAAIASAMITSQDNKDTYASIESVLNSVDVQCMQNMCSDSMQMCMEGSSCNTKLNCVMTADMDAMAGTNASMDAGAGMHAGMKQAAHACFTGLQLPQLDHGLLGILDCGEHQKCMPMTDLGVSLLQEEMRARGLRTSAQKDSLAQGQGAHLRHIQPTA